MQELCAPWLDDRGLSRTPERHRLPHFSRRHPQTSGPHRRYASPRGALWCTENSSFQNDFSATGQPRPMVRPSSRVSAAQPEPDGFWAGPWGGGAASHVGVKIISIRLVNFIRDSPYKKRTGGMRMTSPPAAARCGRRRARGRDGTCTSSRCFGARTPRRGPSSARGPTVRLTMSRG